MAYRVEITAQALADARAVTTYIARHSPAAATRWFDGLMAAVASLAEWPGRGPLAPEATTLHRELHQLLYGKRRGVYRILFLVYHEAQPVPEVRIVAIRHGARRPLEAEDLEWLDASG